VLLQKFAGLGDISRSQAPESVKVLNNIMRPKAMPYKITKSLSEKQPKKSKTG
jgi:hypothetical protein